MPTTPVAALEFQNAPSKLIVMVAPAARLVPSTPATALVLEGDIVPTPTLAATPLSPTSYEIMSALPFSQLLQSGSTPLAKPAAIKRRSFWTSIAFLLVGQLLEA